MSGISSPQGPTYAPAYQVSGIPYIATAGTGATKTVVLKFVTSEITFANSGTTASTINFGFKNGADFTIPANSVATFHVRTKKISFTSGASSTTSIIASLTGIDATRIPTEQSQNSFGTTS
tara:strand:+ start:81 stop:443 length:363 start_codon:yes stop_codon:yes gene_type:complete